MSAVINLPIKDLEQLYFFTKDLEFTVVAGAYSDWELQQLSYLNSSFQSMKFNTESLCRWFIAHKIKYQILYPVDRLSVFRHPVKYYDFLKLKKKLNARQ